MPTTYPGGGPRWTVEALLRTPRHITRALTSLVSKRFVADRIFARGGSVDGGAVTYQKNEDIYMDRDVEEIGVRSEYPRASWSEEVFVAAVKKYGLEFPVSDEAKRRNQLDQVQRAIMKLSNAIVKFVDGKAMTMFLADGDVLTFGASGDWSTATTDIIYDVARAINNVTSQDLGYDPDTMIVNTAQELDLLSDGDIRDVLPRESQINSALTGKAVPLLGLRQVLVTNQLTAGKVIICQSNMVGSIADEQPAGDEGYTSSSPAAGDAQIYTKIYRNDNVDESIVRAVRWPAMWIAEPKSAVVITAA
jgi:hypothetical protein